MRPERLVWAAAPLLLAACAAPAAGGRLAGPPSGEPLAPSYLLVESPQGFQGGEECQGPDLARAIEKERQALQRATGSTVAPRLARRRAEVEEALGERDTRPLVLVYLGHAISRASAPGEPSKTRLCLRDGPVAVDELLSRVSPTRPYVFFLLDTCSAADVDVRASPVPAGVLSASPDQVRTTPQEEKTALAGLLAPALVCADADRDGWIDDRELLDALVQQAGQPVLGNTAIPRLRRQAREALRVFPAPAGPPCTQRSSRPRDPVPFARVEEGAEVLWHPGVVEDPVITDRGRSIRSAQLRPIWCRHQAFGQCFEIRSTAKERAP